VTRDKRTINEVVQEKIIRDGDLSGLTNDEQVEYYNSVCDLLGIDPLTQPFQYLRLNGKLQLYAMRAAAEQLRRVNKISLTITSREMMSEDLYVVTARATDATGRTDESTGAVPLDGLRGEKLANALMKAETKAKRRVTLSIAGLGMLDENEVSSIPDAQTISAEDRETENLRSNIKYEMKRIGWNAKDITNYIRETYDLPEGEELDAEHLEDLLDRVRGMSPPDNDDQEETPPENIPTDKKGLVAWCKAKAEALGMDDDTLDSVATQECGGSVDELSAEDLLSLVDVLQLYEA